MNFIPFDLRKLLLFALAISLPLIYFHQNSKDQKTPWYGVPFSLAGGLFQVGYSEFDNAIRSTTRHYLDLLDIKKQMRVLKEENTKIRTMLTQLEELRVENQRLSQLLEFQSAKKMQMIPAKVIGNDLLTEHFTIVINKGANHDLKKGQAVATTLGVIGYILEVRSYSSVVLLLTDRYAVIDALVQRTRARGIVEGAGPGKATLRYIERSDDVKEGDIIVTSGLDNIFPKGFPIAKVVSVKKESYGVSTEVDLEPVVHSDTVEEVFVIKDANRQDFLAPAAEET